MKPWMLSALVALPACELARKAGGAPMLDIKLAEDAKAAGKQLEGLETVADQLHAMASLPMDFHLKGLIETLKLGDRIDDVIETMIVLYAQGDTGMFWPLFRAVLPDEGEDEAGYAAFEQAMIIERNKTMAKNAEPILAAGNAFIAVGALHLPGPDGLIELLRKPGHTVSAVNTPLSITQSVICWPVRALGLPSSRNRRMTRMTKLLIIAATLGFAASAAACDFMQSAAKVERTPRSSISQTSTQTACRRRLRRHA